MIDAFTAVCGYKHPTCDAKNVFGFCVFLRRQSKSEEAALSSLSRLLFILANLLGNKRSSFVISFCVFVCFKVRCFVFEKHRKFYLSSKIFFIFFTLKHGKFRFQRWNCSFRASKSRGNTDNTATEGWKRTGTFLYVPADIYICWQTQWMLQ